jgi:hypothetical protein
MEVSNDYMHYVMMALNVLAAELNYNTVIKSRTILQPFGVLKVAATASLVMFYVCSTLALLEAAVPLLT